MSDTPESPQGRRTAFLALILSTVVSLFAVEAMLQTADYPAPPKVGWGWAESPYADAQYRGQPPVNEQGLRGEPYGHSEAFTVLLVGDSYIEAGIQPPQDMPEAILRRMLREDYDITDARVVSLAGAGWGQGQQLQAMQDYFADHRADLVLAWLTPVNDYWENTFVDRSTSHEAGPLKPTLMRTNSAASDGWDWFDFSGSPLKLLQLVDLAMMAADATEDQAPVEQHFREMQSSQLPSTDRPARVDTACPERTIDQADLIREFRRDEGPMTVVTTELFSQGRSHFVPFSPAICLRSRPIRPTSVANCWIACARQQSPMMRPSASFIQREAILIGPWGA